MIAYAARRFLYLCLMLLGLSVLAFVVIELPPGNYATVYAARLAETGITPTLEELAEIERRFYLDLPAYLRYFRWAGDALRGDFGFSTEWETPVIRLLEQRVPMTVVLNVSTLLFTYVAAILIGIYSATHQYSIGDYAFSFLGFAGLAVPNFLLALVLMVTLHQLFDLSVTGLFSREYRNADWSVGKVVDLIKHLPVPVIIVGTAGTAELARVMRATLLDELGRQYVITARAKGVGESALLFKYPVRLALNPVISTIGWLLPATISGGAITAIVLSLPTVGPLLFGALLSQDTHLAGSIVLVLGALAIVGTFISDLLLLVIDPRVSFARRGRSRGG